MRVVLAKATVLWKANRKKGVSEIRSLSCDSNLNGVASEDQSKFLLLVDEIDTCRIQGFVRMSLHAALSLPDICAQSEAPNAREGDVPQGKACPKGKHGSAYKAWWNKYSWKYLKRKPLLSGKQLYSLRNNLFHGSNIYIQGKNGVPIMIDISGAATCKYPPNIRHLSLPHSPLNAGVLIAEVLNTARYFYMTSNVSIRAFLDGFERFTILSPANYPEVEHRIQSKDWDKRSPG